MSLPQVIARAASLLALALTSSAALATPSATELVLVGRDGWLFPAWETTEQIYREAYRENLDLMARGLHILQRAGIRVIVGVVPAKARLYPEYLPADMLVSRDFIEHYAEINARLRAQQIETLDMVAPLLAGKGEHPMFARTDSHWTAYGADRVAHAVGVQLRPSLAALAGEPPAGELPGFTPWPIEGDLARLTASPSQEEIWVRIQSKRTATGRKATLFDDDELSTGKGSARIEREPELALVCTSYCEPTLGFPLVFSHAVGKPIDLYWRNGIYGHWKILADYLRSRAERGEAAPKVLVWLVMEGSLGGGPDHEGWRAAGSSMKAEVWLSRLEESVKKWKGLESKGRP